MYIYIYICIIYDYYVYTYWEALAFDLGRLFTFEGVDFSPDRRVPEKNMHRSATFVLCVVLTTYELFLRRLLRMSRAKPSMHDM